MMFSLSKKRVSFLLWAASLTCASAHSFASSTWSTTFGDGPANMYEIYNGNHYVFWYDYSTYANRVSKIGSNGQPTWTYETPYLGDMAVVDDGVFVTEYRASLQLQIGTSLVTKLDHDTGSSEFIGDVSSVENLERVLELAVDNNGYYLLADVRDYNASPRIDTNLLIHLNPNGDVQWSVDLGDLYTTRDLIVKNGVISVLGYVGPHEQVVYTYTTSGQAISQEAGDHVIQLKTQFLDAVEHNGSFYGYFNYGVAGSSNVIVKFNSQGEIVWETPFFDDYFPSGDYYQREIYGVFISNNNLFALGQAALDDTGEGVQLLARYDLDGRLLSIQTLDVFTPYFPYAIFSQTLMLFDGQIMYGLNDPAGYSAIIGALEFDGEKVPSGTTVPVTPPVDTIPDPVDSTIVGNPLALGDINSDGYQDVAVVIKGEAVSVNVDSIGTNANLNSVVFSITDDVADVKAIADQNGNNAPEIALVSGAASKVEIRDSLTGELINDVTFNSNVSPIKIDFVADLNNNGSVEVALLGSSTNGNGKVVMVKDSATGELLNTAYFNPNFTPKDFAFVEDVDGDAMPEVAVLSTDSNNTSKFEIRTLQGEMIKNIWLGKAYNSTQLVTLPVATDNEPTLATALAALQTKVNGSGLTVRVMDVENGEEIQSVNYNSNFNPVTAKAISDINANATPEIAVLGTKTDSSTGETSTKIEVKDSHSGNLVKNVWQNKTVTPIDLTIVADINGNGSPETVTLVEQNDSYKAIVKDSLTGELLDTVAIELD